MAEELLVWRRCRRCEQLWRATAATPDDVLLRAYSLPVTGGLPDAGGVRFAVLIDGAMRTIHHEWCCPRCILEVVDFARLELPAETRATVEIRALHAGAGVDVVWCGRVLDVGTWGLVALFSALRRDLEPQNARKNRPAAVKGPQSQNTGV